MRVEREAGGQYHDVNASADGFSLWQSKKIMRIQNKNKL
jgi:hypothetical protein